MKLLIVTQKVNIDDPILGFFHRWIVEFAKHFESIIVICLEEGRHELPANVKVFSLGKEKNFQFFRKIRYIFKFYNLIWRKRKDYDTVFVHMNPVYVVLGGVMWKILKKKVNLWYTHRNVDMQLILAERLADKIFTASKESFQLKSDKLLIVGHGIDTDHFVCFDKVPNKSSFTVNIVHIGRITKIKNCDTLVKSIDILNHELDLDCKLRFIGDVVTDEDKIYRKYLEGLIQKDNLKGLVSFDGPISHSSLLDIYCDADIAVNATPTGGLDKTVLESMSCGLLVLSSNESFRDYFGRYADRLIFRVGNENDLSRKIKDLVNSTDKDEISSYLRGEVMKRASIKDLIIRIGREIQ